jgi:hypothetical protein
MVAENKKNPRAEGKDNKEGNTPEFKEELLSVDRVTRVTA